MTEDREKEANGHRVKLALLVLLCILVLLGIGLLRSHSMHVAGWWNWRLILAAIFGCCGLYGASTSIFSSEDRKNKRMLSGNPQLIGKVIAFDVVIFIVVGLVLVVGAAFRWEAACLCAGACLIGGGIVGLLFGMPLGNAQVTTSSPILNEAAKTDESNIDPKNLVNTNVATAAPANKIAGDMMARKLKAAQERVASQTLLAQTASSLSKLLAGAGLARFHDLLTFFRYTSHEISQYIDPGMGSSTLGGALILYFTLLGFLSGLFLPAYFMKNWQG